MMDFCSISFVFSFILLLATLLHKLHGHGGGDADARLPPGPWKLPVLGSLHHLLVRPLPDHSLAVLAKRYGPVMHLQLGEVSTIVVSSPAAAAEILKIHDVNFSDRAKALARETMAYGDKGLVLSSYGPYWRELRKMSILELLSARRVWSSRSIREEEALDLVRSIARSADAGEMVNLSRMLLQFTNDVSARIIVGSKCRYQKDFLRIMMIGLKAMGNFNLVELFPSSSLLRLLSRVTLNMHGIHEELDAIMSSIIGEHRQRKKSTDSSEQEEQDLVDAMLKIQNDGSLSFPLTDESIKATILELFIGGSETSATAVEWAMSELMRNPRAMERAQREVREVLSGKEKVAEDDIGKMSYLKLVIKENFRLHPPAPLLVPRVGRESRDIFGYRIPAKTRMLVNAWAIARDPGIWEDAGQFKPERFVGSAVDFKGNNFEFMPFGAGRRMCPGMAFGLASVELLLACLFHYFDWRLPPAEDELDMDETLTLTSRRRSDLCLRAIHRIPCTVD